MYELIHEKENNPDTQSFLDENLDNFNGDVRKVFELMYRGIRLNGFMVVKEYSLDPRRLRDAIAARPDVVKKAWKKDDKGKRLYVEYWIDIPPTPTKKQAIEWATKALDRMSGKDFTQGRLL